VAGGDRARLLLAFTLVTFWAVRLTWNWARGWTGLTHEDWRYVDLRTKSGRAYWGVRCGASFARLVSRRGGTAASPDGIRSPMPSIRKTSTGALLPPAGGRCCQRVGERLERGYAGRSDEVAVELALHFERSRDTVRAGDHEAVSTGLLDREDEPVSSRKRHGGDAGACKPRTVEVSRVPGALLNVRKTGIVRRDAHGSFNQCIGIDDVGEAAGFGDDGRSAVGEPKAPIVEAGDQTLNQRLFVDSSG